MDASRTAPPPQDGKETTPRDREGTTPRDPEGTAPQDGEETACGPSSGASVLVADDDAHNRELLAQVLEARGYGVRRAGDGRAALDSVRASPPDVVLLDLVMPEMTGFEVCQAIKGDPATAHLPVIMITAHSERSNRLQGIEVGANDFLEKPVDRPELLLRVRNAVYQKCLVDQLARKNEELQKLEALRKSFTRMLVHDMRSPLTAIGANLELLEQSLGQDLTPEVQEDLRQARVATRMLSDMVSQILVVSRSEEKEVRIEAKDVILQELVEEALDPLRPLARHHEVEVEFPQEPLPLSCDPGLIRRTVSNLFGNATKFVPYGETIRVRAAATNEGVRVEVEDTGPGIAPRFHDLIFDRFERGPVEAEARGAGSDGLGLAFARMAVEAHGGWIGVESEPGRGSLFWIELPSRPDRGARPG